MRAAARIAQSGRAGTGASIMRRRADDGNAATAGVMSHAVRGIAIGVAGHGHGAVHASVDSDEAGAFTRPALGFTGWTRSRRRKRAHSASPDRGIGITDSRSRA
jgi:hypothetical protein